MSIAAQHRLDGVRLHGTGALSWWLRELRALCVDANRLLSTVAGNAVILEAGEHRWVLRRKERTLGEIDWRGQAADSCRRKLRDLVALASRWGPLIVEIPLERALSKTIHLPAEAKDRLDSILDFEIPRHFPFAADRVFYAHGTPRGLDDLPVRRSQAVSVEIVAVPREVVDSVLAELGAAGLRASSIAVISSQAGARLFLGPESLGGSAAAVPGSRRLLAALMVLAGIVVASWPVAQNWRLAVVQQEIERLRPQAERALRDRRDSRRAAEQAAAISDLRNGRPPLLAVLDLVSREVPDGAWLTSLAITGRDVVLEGRSPSAAAIALALGKSPGFSDVVFRSAIARDAATGLEQFQLGATLTQVRR